MSLSRIALIYRETSALNYQRVAVFKETVSRAGIDCRIYNGVVQMTESGYDPECVLVLNADEAKLGSWPTYAILDASPSSVLGSRKRVRNILTCDGYLAISKGWEEIVTDLSFSARKFGACIERFGLTPSAAGFGVPDFSKARLAYVTSNIGSAKSGKGRLYLALRKAGELDIFTSWHAFARKVKVPCRFIPHTPEAVAEAYRSCGIGIDFFSCDDDEKIPSWRLMEIIAAGAVAITNWSSYLYSIFGDNLLYIPTDISASQSIEVVRGHVEFVRNNPAVAKAKAAKAFDIFKKMLALEAFLPNLNKVHEDVRIKQGYERASNAVDSEPSVSIILRTGSHHPYIRMALDSLVAQGMRDIRVVFVIYEPADDLPEIMRQYQPHLTYKVVENIGGLRSTSILLGLKNVDGDYFMLLDDDDIINPNHLRSLINTINFHNKLDWRGEVKVAYSGTYFASESMAFPEALEWQEDVSDRYPSKRQIEHFRFYDPAKMSAFLWYTGSNSWLAHRSILSEELLRDSFTHTGEDLHLEMQFALHTHFAFSCEMTAAHCFHGANATIVDRHRNTNDFYRHIRRLGFRRFPSSSADKPKIAKMHESTGIFALPTVEPVVPRYLRSVVRSMLASTPFEVVIQRVSEFKVRVKSVGWTLAMKQAFGFIVRAFLRKLKLIG